MDREIINTEWGLQNRVQRWKFIVGFVDGTLIQERESLYLDDLSGI